MRRIGIGFLLLTAPFLALVAAPTGLAQDAEPLYLLEDPPGDVRPSIFGLTEFLPETPPTAPNAVTDPYDLLAFRITEESVDRIVMEAEFRDLTGPAAPASGPFNFNFGGQGLTVSFGLGGTEILYELDAFVEYADFVAAGGVYPEQPVRVPAQICIATPETGCYPQPAEAAVHFPANKVYITITKVALVGREPVPYDGFNSERPAALPSALRPGQALQDWRVVREGGDWYDALPNGGAGGGPFQLSQPMANTVLRVVRDTAEEEAPSSFFNPFQLQDAGERVAVTPGSPTVVPVRVENTAETQRMVNLTVSFSGALESGKWSAMIAPTIQIPSGDSRVVNLVINASSRVLHREVAEVLVRADALGNPEEIGLLRVELMGSVPPSAEKRNLYFHGAQGFSFFNVGPTSFLQFHETWLNTLEDDDRATRDDEGVVMPGFFGFIGEQSWQSGFATDTPLAHDLVFDVAHPVEATVALSGRVAFQGTLRASLYSGDVYLGGGTAPASVGSAPSPTTVTFFLAPENARVKAEGQPLFLAIELMSSDPAATLSGEDGVLVHPRQSLLTLPLIPDPNPPEAAIAAGPSAISLYSENATEDFVNPNETAFFPFVLVNEGIAADQVELNVSTDGENWIVEIRPARQYDLQPGQTVSLALMVTAPPEAAEGEEITVLVNATSLTDNASVARLQFRVTATIGVEIEDEKDAFTADDDTLSLAIREEERDSPGFGLVPLVGAALVAGLVFSRRRSGRRNA